MRKLLDGFTPSDVFEAIGGDVPRTALFTSYTFSPAAFSDQYLRELQRRGCEKVVVLVDSLGYAQSLDDAAYADGVGTDYLLRAVPMAGAFHAKLVVVQTARKTVLGVGSGNLTVAGLLANAEVGGLCVLDNDDSQKAVADICVELMALAGLRESQGSVPEPVLVADDTWFITSLHRSIADQLSIDAGVESIIITTPFADQSKRVMTWLRRRWPSTPIRIRIDPLFENLSDDFMRSVDAETTVQVPAEPSSGSRGSIHGKLFVWRRQNDAFVALGSANMTAPALLERTNIEAVLLRRASLSDAKYLLRVPGTSWRKVAAADVRSAAPPLESAEVPHALVAELQARQLSLAWRGEQESGDLAVLVRGSVAAERRLEGKAGDGGLVIATVQLTNDELASMSGPRVARLVTDDGTLFQGWVEVKELLETPPESKKRLQFLRDLISNPDTCDENEVVHFLEWLRRGLHEDHFTRRRSATASESHDDADEQSQAIQRSLLLIEDMHHGASGSWEQIVEASFDSASASIHFFDAELRAVNRSGRSALQSERRSESGGNKPSAPPSVTAILQALFGQLAQSLDVANSSEAVAARLKQLPMCLKALKYCQTRWHISSKEARRFFTQVVLAFLGPGEESVVQKSGVLKRLTPEQCRSVGEYQGINRSAAYLHGILLTLYRFGEIQRVDAVKDMQDLFLKSFSNVPASDIVELQDELSAVLGDGDFSFAAIQEELTNEEGEVGRLQRQRESLRKLVSLFQTNGATEEQIAVLCREATSSDETKRHLLILFEYMDGARSRVRLEEVSSESDACPNCFMAIPQGELARMSDATFVHRHRCGVLLVKAIE